MKAFSFPKFDKIPNYKFSDSYFGRNHSHHHDDDRGESWNHHRSHGTIDISDRSTSLTGDVVEDAPETPSPSDSLDTSGTIAFRGKEWSDFSVSVMPLQSSQLGVFDVSDIEQNSSDHHRWNHGHHHGHSNGHGMDLNTVNWSYSLDNSAAQYLGEGEAVTENYKVTIKDEKGHSVDQIVTITITGTNDAPVAESITGGASETGPAIILAANFTDVDISDAHSFAIDTTGTLGTVTNNHDGTFNYDPNGQFNALAAGETATDTFTYTVDDGHGGTATAVASVTILGVGDGNHPPVADAIVGTAEENGPAIVLTALFTDVDTSDAHSFAVDTTGTVGSVVNNADGTFSYDPNGQFESLAVGETATDTFTYTVDDGQGGLSTQIATVTINGVDLLAA